MHGTRLPRLSVGLARFHRSRGAIVSCVWATCPQSRNHVFAANSKYINYTGKLWYSLWSVFQLKSSLKVATWTGTRNRNEVVYDFAYLYKNYSSERCYWERSWCYWQLIVTFVYKLWIGFTQKRTLPTRRGACASCDEVAVTHVVQHRRR